MNYVPNKLSLLYVTVWEKKKGWFFAIQSSERAERFHLDRNLF